MSDASFIESIQRFYDAVARRCPDQPFLNYGFDDAAEPAGDANLATGCRRLYEAVLLPFPEGSQRVVEVGCGRGGGAEFLLEVRPGLRYLGLDLSTEHLGLCRRRFASRTAARFAQADAARLPVPDGCVDAVFSIEAAQHFEHPERFYLEAARVLRRGGWFLLASLWQPGHEPTKVFEACGFRLAERHDITANVVASLARTSAARQALIDSLELPERFRPLLLSWAGVRGHGSYESLASGSLAYVRYRLVREQAIGRGR